MVDPVVRAAPHADQPAVPDATSKPQPFDVAERGEDTVPAGTL